MRRATAEQFPLQVVLVYLCPFRRNSLLKSACAPATNCKINTKTTYFGGSRSFKVIDVDTTKSLSLLLVMINSMSVPICNRFHATPASSGKITTFRGGMRGEGVAVFNANLCRPI